MSAVLAASIGNVMDDCKVLRVERLALSFEPRPWPFAQQHAGEIAAYFEDLRRRRPRLWNGRVLLLHDHAVDGNVFRGSFFETDFASFIAWRDWEFPDRAVVNCFAMGAIRSGDKAFLLGVMSEGTANAGRVYFAAGMPDPDDIAGASVDFDGSVWREVAEETGLSADDLDPEPCWHVVLAGARIACIKVLQSDRSAADLRSCILGHLEREKDPELAGIHVARGPADLDARMPPFVKAFLDSAWTGRA